MSNIDNIPIIMSTLVGDVEALGVPTPPPEVTYYETTITATNDAGSSQITLNWGIEAV